MTFSLTRTSEVDALQVTKEHDLLARPRRGPVDWHSFDRAAFTPAQLANAEVAWRARALTEMHSLALFTQLTGQVQMLGAPLDWSGAFVRVLEDEVRHVDLCLRMLDLVGAAPTVQLDAGGFQLPVRGVSLRSHVRRTIVAAFCIGETLSGRMFRRAMQVATVPVAREVVHAILVDESFHAEFGWEIGAMLMRDCPEAERVELVEALPGLFQHFAEQCGVEHGPQWTAAQPDVDEGPNFGLLSMAGYAHAFFEGMEADVVPGLDAIGLPEAGPAWATWLQTLR